jgi:hypothetical protein
VAETYHFPLNMSSEEAREERERKSGKQRGGKRETEED